MSLQTEEIRVIYNEGIKNINDNSTLEEICRVLSNILRRYETSIMCGGFTFINHPYYDKIITLLKRPDVREQFSDIPYYNKLLIKLER